MFAGARILVAPLDWGLGHAARCIPVVRALLEHGAVPVIGADKGPLALLREAFPMLEHVRIPGMDVRYGRGRSQSWALARQFPAMLRQVRQEHAWLAANRKLLQLDAVISDQRFGLHAHTLPSVLVTHQVFPFTPFGQGVARRINRRNIGRFDRYWIPDHATAPGLAGALSHGSGMPGNALYIGPLSRFRRNAAAEAIPRYRVVAVISGPEPQRSIFEDKVLEQLHSIEGRHLVVAGRPGKTMPDERDHTRLVPHLDAETLGQALVGADLIVGRAGYSTLMDLHALGRAALLVPTPGQPEQEYLAKLHARAGRHVVQRQDELDLAAALNAPPQHPGPSATADALDHALADLARACTSSIFGR